MQQLLKSIVNHETTLVIPDNLDRLWLGIPPLVLAYLVNNQLAVSKLIEHGAVVPESFKIKGHIDYAASFCLAGLTRDGICTFNGYVYELNEHGLYDVDEIVIDCVRRSIKGSRQLLVDDHGIVKPMTLMQSIMSLYIEQESEDY